MIDQEKPWAGEFPLDDPNDMDDAAVRILLNSVFGGGSQKPYFEVPNGDEKK